MVFLSGKKAILEHCTKGKDDIYRNASNLEKEEVILSKGDGMLDAGCLTKCKNAVCFIYCNGDDSIKRGTGFYASIKIREISYDVIVTNNHVINTIEDARNASVRFHYEGKVPGADSKLLPDKLFFTNEVLDYTIIGCDSDSIENRFCIDPIEFENEGEINIGDDIFIFQHPKGETKKLSYQKISNIDRPFVYYNADTDIGSSGSCVLRKFKLIAIHSKGSDVLKYNKGTLSSEILNHLNHGTYTSPNSIEESACNNKRRSPDEPEITHENPKRICIEEIGTNSLNTVELTEALLEDISKDILGYWKHLGRKLNLPNSKIESIQKDHINYDDIREKAFAMLLAWKENNSSDNLVDVLKSALVNYGKVEIANKYFPNQ